MSAPPAALATPAGPAGPARVMLLGDSVTHGSTGDWTWRYRLWQHLQGAGGGVDFVGPDTETAGYGGGPAGYADPAFDTDHAAMWGRQAAEGVAIVGGLVEEYRPDVLVVNLGVNDLTWGGADVSATVDLLEQLVVTAQAVAPDIEVVVGELPQEWLMIGPYGSEPRVAQVNELLPAMVAGVSTETSRVVLAETAAGLTSADSYDWLHPTAAGEVKIAAAVADALAVLGVGVSYPRPLPVVPAVPATAPAVTVVSASGLARVSWSPVLGATSYAVSYRPVEGGPWAVVDDAVSPVTLPGLANDRRYVVRVQGFKETQAGAVGEAVAAPQYPRPGAVGKVRAKRGKRTLAVSWPAAVGALSYRVEWRRPGRVVRSRLVPGQQRLVLRRLVPGRRYVVSVVPLAGEVAGPRARAVFKTRRR